MPSLEEKSFLLLLYVLLFKKSCVYNNCCQSKTHNKHINTVSGSCDRIQIVICLNVFLNIWLKAVLDITP